MLSTPAVVALVTDVANQSTSSPIYHVLVEEIDNPAEVFKVALEELQASTDTERAFRILWDAARQIGANNCACSNEFNKGFSMGRSQGIAEGQKLGFEEGRRAGLEQLERQAKHMAHTGIQASVEQQDSSTDTSDLASTKPPSLPNPTTSTPVSWADDSNSMPVVTLIPPSASASATPAARDNASSHSEHLSALPFGSLQHRSHRSRRSCRRGSRQQQHSSNSFHANTVMPTSILQQSHSFRNSPLITRCHPKGIGPGKPVEIFHVSASKPVPQPTPASRSSWIPKPVLDWVGDPRLAQLGQLLGELGWVRQFH